MDYYRHVHGPFPGCVSHDYLMQILAVGEPRVARSYLRVRDILDRQESVFFPKDEVRKVLGHGEVLERILRCRCGQCQRYLIMNAGESKEIAHSILSQDRPKVVLLAILLYLGRSFLIRHLAQQDSVHDAALTIDREILSADDFPDLLGSGSQADQASSPSSEEQEWFLDNYHLARMLFDPPAFRSKDKWTFNYPKDCRFPFLDDEKHGEGSFGEVYKFNIHQSYLDIDSECANKDWYRHRREHTFARKVLRKKNTNRMDWSLEKAALRAISLQNHPNIIELLFVYQWREQYIFVFPFVERNLHQVLHSDWCPATSFNRRNGTLESHWLWRQMINIADALRTIHDPPVDASDIGYDGPVIGFHFDLKPANILVKNDGSLQITDFGQALIKNVDADDMTYGVHRGGSLVYQAPETCPTRTAMEHAGSDNRVHRRYDVWSLACIMLEVLVFILEKGTKGLEAFEEQRREEPVQGAFYSGSDEKRLKSCVRQRLAKYEAGSPDAKSNQMYLSELLGLLNKMFDVDQHSRPSSAIVYQELDRFAKGIYGGIVSKRQKESWVIKNPVPEGFIELCWQGPTGIRSFLDANAVIVRPRQDSKAGPVSCYLRLLLNSEKQALRLIQFRGSEPPDEIDFSLLDLIYCPLYMYNNETEKLACNLSYRQYSMQVNFASTRDLYNFQHAVLQSSPLSGLDPEVTRLEIELVRITRLGAKQVDVLSDALAIQVQVFGAVEIPTLIPPKRSAPSGGYTNGVQQARFAPRIIIFMPASRTYISIPLYSDKSLIAGKNNRETIILPNKTSFHESFRFFDGRISEDSRYRTSLPVSGHEPKENLSSTKIELQFTCARDRTSFERMLEVAHPLR